MLRRTQTASLAIALLLPAMLRADDALKAVDKDLEGEWKTVSEMFDGADVPPAGRMPGLTIKADVLTASGPDVGGLPTARIKGDASKAPKTLDLTPDGGAWKGETFLGVYEVKGDELRICLAEPDNGRPTDFSVKEGSRLRLYVLKRVKK